MSNTDNSGATVDPLAEQTTAAAKQECPGDGKGQRFAHKFAWVKDDAKPFSNVQCQRCGKIETR